MTPLWTPSKDMISESNITAFINMVNERHDLLLEDDRDLYEWSITNIETFWDNVWDFCEITGEKGTKIIVDAMKMPCCQFYPEGKLNYAENLLQGRQAPEDTAIHFWGEDKIKRSLTFKELEAQVSKIQQFFVAKGIQKGDRIAALMPNTPETLIAMLAATSLGAIWSSASPDFGTHGILDRFGQIEPAILITTDGYYYNGKWVDCTDKLDTVIPQIPSLRCTILVSYDPEKTIDPIQNSILWHDILKDHDALPLLYTHVEFHHPLFIMFSSGTTGKPKCIVHGTGGTLLQHAKEHRLHCDVKPGDRVFYFTTCGWMMWNWLVSGLASGATLCLYDGSPFSPDGNILFDYCDAVDFTFFGISAKYIDTLNKQHYTPAKTHRMDSLRTIASTGSVLVPESFDYVYSHIKKDVHLASISGGTDIVSCFMLGYPTRPVYRGELQGAGLGLAVEVYKDNGTPAKIQEKGELVCTKPFPCMPIGFWNDASGEKYHQAYFNRFPGIWHHGDYIEKTLSDGFIIHGRSDATLNPGGVRIGTAEIYGQVEKLEEITESVVVAQHWKEDERVVLFVILKKDIVLDNELVTRIKKQIREGASPRHVPAKIIPVTDIPRTKNNKLSEIAVRDTINGKPVANTEALMNPESLELYQNLPELEQD